jgi:hypothetical protein
MTKKMVLSAALALVALLATSAMASAFTATVSPSGSITSASSGKVRFVGGSTTIECNLTLRGSLNSSVTLTAGQSLGRISAVEIANCSGGNSVTVLNLPWTLEYTESEGELPNEVTGVDFKVKNSSFNLGIFGGFINCLYQGDEPSILSVTGTNPYTSGTISTDGTHRIPLHSGGGCPSTGTMTGTFGLSPSQEIRVA